MERKQLFSLNRIDLYILQAIAVFILNSMLLWVVSNVLRLNDAFIWFLLTPLSLVTVNKIFSSGKQEREVLTKKQLLPYIVLLFCICISVLFFLEPAITRPFSAIGIPNKDLHDGIATYIASHGFPPADHASDAAYIHDSKNGLFLEYPNALHVTAGYLIKLGFFQFHATWFAIGIALLFTSLSIFIFIKTLVKDGEYLAALFGGLFVFSSFRLPFSVIVSIPMAYSYLLILPSLLLCLYIIDRRRNALFFFLGSSALGLLAAAYSGTIIIFLGILLLYGFFVFLEKDYNSLSRLCYLVLYSFPLLLLVFLFQSQIYWENTFPTAIDYDPAELSQYIVLIDSPIYMIGYGISAVVLFFSVIQKKLNLRQAKPIFFVIFLCNIFLFLPFIYQYIFRAVNGIINLQQLSSISPDGLFGGLMNQKMSRIALLQPYFFFFLIVIGISYIQKKWLQYLLVALLLFTVYFLKADSTFYQWDTTIQSVMINRGREEPLITKLSDIRFITNEEIWSEDIVNALQYLKFHGLKNDSIVVWDEQNWSEQSIVNWGSIYLEHTLFSRADLAIPYEISLSSQYQKLKQKNIQYIVAVHPRNSLQTILADNKNLSALFTGDEVYIFAVR